MGATRYRDIVIRGQVFSTAQAAAAHFGLTPDTVRVAARKGTLHRVGTGASHPEPLPVRVRGVVYASAKVAAAEIGVTPGAVFQALAQNRIDTVGLGMRCPRPFRSRPIKLGPMVFSSMAAADRALGFRAGYVAHSLKLGRKSAIETIVAAAMALDARGRDRLPEKDEVRRSWRWSKRQAVGNAAANLQEGQNA